MKLSKITHRHEARIRVDFPYNAADTARLRQIPDARWSRTIKAWHVPYTKEVFKQLKELFPDVEYVETRDARSLQKEMVTTPRKIELAPNETEIVSKQISSEISIEITARHIYVKIPKNETDIAFIRSFKYAKWNTNLFCWTIPN